MAPVLPLDKNKCDFSSFWSFCSNEIGKAEDAVLKLTLTQGEG